MKKPRMAVVGIGATGAVLAAALLARDPEVALVDPRPGLEADMGSRGILVSGVLSFRSPVRRFFPGIEGLKDLDPDIIFISTKTFHLPQVMDELGGLFRPGMRIISTHNGLGTEDVIGERFGRDAAFRLSLNLGASLKGPVEAETAFFNRPNHLGCLDARNREAGLELAGMLTDCGLDTEFVDDIKLYVWKKMVMKCTMASLCAVTDKTIKECLDFPPTREIADACFREILTVARAKGYDPGEGYLRQAVGYLEKVGAHKDSMCYDLANKTPTEIDFLGGKVVEYGRELGIPTPFYTTMTNLVKALESHYLGK